MKYLLCLLFFIPSITVNRPITMHDRLCLLERMMGINEENPTFDYVINDSTRYLIVRPNQLKWSVEYMGKIRLVNFDSIVFIDEDSDWNDTVTVWTNYAGNR